MLICCKCYVSRAEVRFTPEAERSAGGRLGAAKMVAEVERASFRRCRTVVDEIN